MKVITGKVVNGRIELPPGEVPEGTSVAVVAPDPSEPVELSVEDEHLLLDRLEAVGHGEFVDGEAFLKELRARQGRAASDPS